ncbi:MAG TPA: hypothetical protein VE734_00870 [Terriglobales bacterium]|nr:hypothetical protein [Terriglobales bacterium]
MAQAIGQVEQLVKQAAVEAGFDLAGIALARLCDSRELRFFSDWIAGCPQTSAEAVKKLSAKAERGASVWLDPGLVARDIAQS